MTQRRNTKVFKSAFNPSIYNQLIYAMRCYCMPHTYVSMYYACNYISMIDGIATPTEVIIVHFKSSFPSLEWMCNHTYKSHILKQTLK